MNNNQLFDEHIKEQLGDYSPPVAPHIWDNIVAKRQKRKPAGFWYNILNSRNILIFMALLLAGGSGAWLLTRDKHTTKNIASTPDTSNKTTATTVNNIPVSPVNNDLANNNTTLSPGPALNNSTTTSSVPVPDPNAINSTVTSTVRTHSPFFGSDVQNGPVAYNKKISGKTKASTSIQTTPGNLIDNENKTDGLNTESLPVGGSLLGRLMFTAEKIAANQKNSGQLLVRTPFGFLPDCPSMEKNTAGNKKYFEIYAGPDYALRSLKDTGNSTYLQKRKESAKFTSAYSAGIRYTRVFKNSISVRAGVNYSQINEKFTFVQGGLVQVTYIIDAHGDTTGSYITSGTRYKTTHNKYRSIDVPIMVGYELGNGKLHANINAGPVINVYSWQNGEVLDTSYQPVNITTGKGSSPYQFKTNAGIGFMGAVSVYYKVTDKIHVMVEPYYRHNFSQMNKENLTLKQKYNTAGIRVGVRLDLR